MNPARGILSSEEINSLVQHTLKHGGLISYKNNPDGSRSPYEMNISYFDALSDPNSHETIDLQVSRFMASQAIMLTLRGLPGIYFHSLFGSRGWREGVSQTGQNRTINRQKLELSPLEKELAEPSSLRSRVFSRYSELLRTRASSPAFSPWGTQEILDYGPGVFALRRGSADGRHTVLCLQNVTNLTQDAGGHRLEPYQTLWIKA